MTSRVLLFLVSYLVWALLNWPPDRQHLVIGAAAAAFTAYMMGNLFVGRPRVFRHPRRYWYFCACYLPYFLWKCLKANLDVARRILHPALPLRPGIVRIKTKLKTDTALAFFANSIALATNAMTVDIDQQKGILYIHWIDAGTTDAEGAGRAIAGKFEEILGKVFE